MRVQPTSPGRAPVLPSNSKPLTIYCTEEEREFFKGLRGLIETDRADITVIAKELIAQYAEDN